MLLYQQLENSKDYRLTSKFHVYLFILIIDNNGLCYKNKGGEIMDKKKKKMKIKKDDLSINGGKIVINNEELANAIESEEFIIDGEETKDGLEFTIKKT